VLWHESVHSFLSFPILGPLAKPWQLTRWVAYNLFGTFRFAEEAVAEGYAYYRATGLLRGAILEGVKHPSLGGYIRGVRSFVPDILAGGGTLFWYNYIKKD